MLRGIRRCLEEQRKWLLGQRPIIYINALRRGSLSYLNCEAPMDKDDRSSLSSQEELWVTICFIFEEVQKIIFENILIFFRDMAFLSCPTDNSGQYPTEDSKGSESFMCRRDQRMIKARRQVQCFIRLCNNISDLTEFVKHELRRQPDAGYSTKIKCIQSE